MKIQEKRTSDYEEVAGLVAMHESAGSDHIIENIYVLHYAAHQSKANA